MLILALASFALASELPDCTGASRARTALNTASSAPSGCSPETTSSVELLPPGTVAALADPKLPNCSPILSVVPRRIVDGTSTLLFELGHPHSVADTAFLVPGAIPASSPIAKTWFRDEPAQNMPVYVDGVRMMRRGMLY